MEEREENSKGYVKCLESGYRYFKEKYLFSINSNFKVYFENNNRISEDFKKKMEGYGHLLSSNAKISSVDNIEWRIKDKKKEYIIRELDNKLKIYKKREKREKKSIIRYFVFDFPKINYFAMSSSISTLVVLLYVIIILTEDIIITTIMVLALTLIFVLVLYYYIKSFREKIYNYYYDYLRFEVKSI